MTIRAVLKKTKEDVDVEEDGRRGGGGGGGARRWGFLFILCVLVCPCLPLSVLVRPCLSLSVYGSLSEK